MNAIISSLRYVVTVVVLGVMLLVGMAVLDSLNAPGPYLQTLLRMASAQQASVYNATVQWTHDGVQTTAYQIERKAEGGAYALAGSVPGSMRIFQDPTALGVGTYCYRVRPMNNTVGGAWTADACQTTAAIAPPAGVTTVIITIQVGPPPVQPPAAPGSMRIVPPVRKP